MGARGGKREEGGGRRGCGKQGKLSDGYKKKRDGSWTGARRVRAAWARGETSAGPGVKWGRVRRGETVV